MQKKSIKWIFSVTILISMALYAEKKEAVCIAPVADLLGSRAGSPYFYEQIPLDGPFERVRRIDQLLFNERVFVIERRGDESRVEIPTHGYGTITNAALKHEYWILTKNIALVSEIPDTDAIPSTAAASKTLITLIAPFQDNKHHRRYAAGTRFVLDDMQDDNNYYRALILSPRLKTEHAYIPKTQCIKNKARSPQQKIKNFLAILEKFADQSPGYVPYVLGGNSFIKPYRNTISVNPYDDTRTTTYPTPSHTHSGFDCASLVFRAAQMADIPLYLKNSLALKHHLRPLDQNESVENGDIIFIPGHIIVIFDKDNNSAIESRTHMNHGYGYVHKITFAELFKEIETIDDLVRYHYSKKLVSRLNINREVHVRAPITILKLKSVFEN